MNILCIFFITISIIIGVIGHRNPKSHLMVTKCCKTENSTQHTEFVGKMIKLAEECRQELGQFNFFEKKTLFLMA